MSGIAPPLFPAPPPTYDPKYMATLVRAFSAYVEQLRSAQPLPHVASNTNATTDGVLMWDPVAQNIVVSSSGAWVPYVTSPVALTDLSDVTVATPAQGQVLVRGASEFQNLTVLCIPIGPLFAFNIPAAATTLCLPQTMTSGTAVDRAVVAMKMEKAGRVVGVHIQTNGARTAGTLTAKIRVNSGSSDLGATVVQLNATNTLSASGFVSYTNGVAFAAGDTIGAEVDASALWAPTTADISVTLYAMLQPF
jgi:hypothetical protein